METDLWSVHSRIKFKYDGQFIQPYTKSKYRLNDEEVNCLREWIGSSKSNMEKKLSQTDKEFSGQINSDSKTQKIIFDTDLGSDIDDSLALLAALHLPKNDIEILGITTVYGWVDIRTRLCEKIVQGYDLRTGSVKPNYITSIPVICGEGKPFGSQKDIWHSMTEGISEGMTILSVDEVNEMRKDVSKHSYEAAKFIIEQVHKYPHEITILLIGAATNLIIAIELDPSIVDLIQHVVFMGMGGRMDDTVTSKWEHQPFPLPPKKEQEINAGVVYPFYPGHNITCDLYSSKSLFSLSPTLKISVVNDTVTTKNWWSGEACEQLINCSTGDEKINGEMKIVGLLLKEWFEYRSSIFNTKIDGTCPHDVLALLEAIYPGKYVQYSQGHLLIHEYAGFSSFVADPLGPHRIGIVLKVESNEFIKDISNLILNTTTF
jgi:inosine-uridine nucleoside N-ribohydrolase